MAVEQLRTPCILLRFNYHSNCWVISHDAIQTDVSRYRLTAGAKLFRAPLGGNNCSQFVNLLIVDEIL